MTRLDLMSKLGFESFQSGQQREPRRKKMFANIFDQLDDFPIRGIKVGEEDGAVIISIALQSEGQSPVIALLPFSLDHETARRIGEDLINSASAVRFEGQSR